MGSLRTPGIGETIASDEQPPGYHDEGEKVQAVGTQLWDGTGWVDMAGDTQPTGAHNAKARVLNAGQMLWESVKKEWIPASSGATKDSASINENQPVQNMLLNEATGTMDRQRNNSEMVEIAKSEARSKAFSSSALVNYNARGLQIDFGITVAGSGHLTLEVLGPHGNSCGIEFSPVTGVLNHIFTVYPGIAQYPEPVEGVQGTVSGAATRSAVIGRQFYIYVEPSEEVDWTYSLAYQLIL